MEPLERRLARRRESTSPIAWMLPVLFVCTANEAVGQPHVDAAGFEVEWTRDGAIPLTGQLGESSSGGAIISPDPGFHVIADFSMPLLFSDGNVLPEMIAMQTTAWSSWGSTPYIIRPRRILNLEGLTAGTSARTEVGRLFSPPDEVNAEHFALSQIDFVMRWRETSAPPEPVDEIPGWITTKLTAGIDYSHENYDMQAFARLSVVYPPTDFEVGYAELRMESKNLDIGQEQIERTLPILWIPDVAYHGQLVAQSTADHKGSSDHPRGFGKAWATADPVIEIDPAFPYADYYELDISPNLVPPTVEYVQFSKAMINDASQIGFRSEGIINDDPVTIFHVGNETQLDPLAYTGLEAPGTSEDFKSLVPAVLNGQGVGAFLGTFLELPEPYRSGIWVGQPDDLQLLALVGVPAPSVSDGANLISLSSPSLSNNGQATFSGGLGGNSVDLTNNLGIWVGTPGNVQLLVRKGEPVPDFPVGTVFSGLSGGRPMINGVGQVAFRADITGPFPDVIPINDSGIWIGTPGALELVVRENDPAPGLSAGLPFNQRAFFDLFDDEIRINDAGHIAFTAKVKGNNVSPNIDDYTIFAGPADALELVMRRRDPIPGSTDVFFSFPRPTTLVLGGGGHVAFQNLVSGAGVTSDNNDALWYGTPSDLDFLAREGDQVPGTENDITFATFVGRPVTNDWSVAFQATLAGPGVTAANQDGIWGLGPAGQLQLVARTGDELNVGDGVFKTISELLFLDESGGEDGLGTSFNDLGQLILSVTFTDGSFDVFVSNVLTTILSADFDVDGDVDGGDFLKWQRGESPNLLSASDLALWEAHYGDIAPLSATSATVPEPSSTVLLILLAAVSNLLRRRGCAI